MKEFAKYTAIGIACLIGLLLLMVVLTGVDVFGLKLSKFTENARTDITRSTNQYVTTQQTALLSLANQYRQAESEDATVSMQAIRQQMEAKAALIQQDQIPQSAYQILYGN